MTGLKIFIQLSLLFSHLYKITGVNHQLRLNFLPSTSLIQFEHHTCEETWAQVSDVF